jgi:hypothetical protein
VEIASGNAIPQARQDDEITHQTYSARVICLPSALLEICPRGIFPFLDLLVSFGSMAEHADGTWSCVGIDLLIGRRSVTEL